MTGLEVAYLVSQYPKVSHIFIEREIAALRAQGARVETFTVRPCEPDQLLSQQMRDEADNTTVLLSNTKRLAARQFETAKAAPGKYVSGLLGALRTGHATPKARIWQGFYYAEAVSLMHEMRDRGLRHVHAHFANNGADVARLVARLGRQLDGPDAGWQWSFTMHGSSEFDAVAHYDLGAKVEEATGVACISDFTRSQMMRLVEREHWDKLVRVPMSVDTDAYAMQDRSARPETDPVRILSVGRLVEVKGYPILLDAIAALRANGINVEARIVGDGPMMGQLREQVATLGLHKVVDLPGAMGQEELPAQYAWADAYCLSSFQEGLPVVLMEAMASGLPVVATRVAAVAELVAENVTGHVVTAARVDVLADALRAICQDKTKRLQMGQEGRAVVESGYSTQAAGRMQYAFLQQCQQAGKVAAQP